MWNDGDNRRYRLMTCGCYLHHAQTDDVITVPLAGVQMVTSDLDVNKHGGPSSPPRPLSTFCM